MLKKILFLVAHRPGRSPGQRFRFEQYLNYLGDNGFECHISYLIDEKDDQIFYAPGKYFQKGRFLLKSFRQRWRDVKNADNYDLVFLYREAHMLGITFFEQRLKKLGVKMVLDFDDSIWLRDVSSGNQNLAFLKRPQKTAEIIRMCDACVVGNRYLADYAARYSNQVYIIPTTIDTDYYLPLSNQNPKEEIVIGWTGSSTTIKHFSLAVPVLRQMKEKYGSKVKFIVISDDPYRGELDGLENVKWSKSSEVEDLNRIDIGIMPLPDDAWAKGKCGFKGLQYMALGKPAVMSPVGVNTEIIDHGVNGFLADSHDEWTRILIRLIEDEELRMKIGAEGRRTVVNKYSFHSQKEIYAGIFRELTNNSR